MTIELNLYEALNLLQLTWIISINGKIYWIYWIAYVLPQFWRKLSHWIGGIYCLNAWERICWNDKSTSGNNSHFCR